MSNISNRQIGRRIRDSKFYARYHDIRKRCYSPRHQYYCYYGQRGITMCDEWLNDFWSFEKWCNETYIEGHTLERIDNTLGYSPKNCRWATMHEQNQNKSNVTLYNGLSLMEHIRRNNMIVNYATARDRINKFGWPCQLAVSTPPGVRLREVR